MPNRSKPIFCPDLIALWIILHLQTIANSFLTSSPLHSSSDASPTLSPSSSSSPAAMRFNRTVDEQPPSFDRHLPSRHSFHDIQHPAAHAPGRRIHPEPRTAFACVVHLPRGCSCTKEGGSLSLNCSQGRLHSIPRTLAEVGSILIKNLTLEHSHIHFIHDGDFFGLKIERLMLGHNAITKLDFLAFWGLEYSLEALDLSHNRFTEVPTEALRLLRNLRSLSLKGNRITALKDFDFGYLRNLEVLALDKNPIKHVSLQAFAGTHLYLLSLTHVRVNPSGLDGLPTTDLRLLKGLSLLGNRIQVIPPGGWFRNMKALRYLSLDDNGIKDISGDDTFLGLEETLRTLELSGNRLIAVPAKALSRLTNLEALDLSGNRIRKLQKRSFNASRSLVTLDLSANRIAKISHKAFVGLIRVQKIDLRNNHIVTLEEATLSNSLAPFHGSTVIYLSDNPWLCNCMVKWLRRDLKKLSGAEGSYRVADAKSMKCDRPFELETTPLLSVPLKDFTCDHEYYYYYYDDDDSGAAKHNEETMNYHDNDPQSI